MEDKHFLLELPTMIKPHQSYLEPKPRLESQPDPELDLEPESKQYLSFN